MGKIKNESAVSGRVAPELSGSFPDRLAQARKSKGWTQSDLARKVWGETTDKRGYPVAAGRDKVSAYEKGKVTPTDESLSQVADALGVPVEELAPDLLAERAFSSGGRAIDLKIVAEGVFLRVNVLTDLETATKVVALLSGKTK